MFRTWDYTQKRFLLGPTRHEHRVVEVPSGTFCPTCIYGPENRSVRRQSSTQHIEGQRLDQECNHKKFKKNKPYTSQATSSAGCAKPIRSPLERVPLLARVLRVTQYPPGSRVWVFWHRISGTGSLSTLISIPLLTHDTLL